MDYRQLPEVQQTLAALRNMRGDDDEQRWMADL